MLPLNASEAAVSTFLLIGIPGLEGVYIWISIPICLMYFMAILGNCTILFVIRTEPSLHEPMYHFLSMLALSDLGLSFSSLPTMLRIFLFNAMGTSVDACIAQKFFIHGFTDMESSVLLIMSFDRFLAICNPLRYTVIMNPRVCLQMALVSWGGGALNSLLNTIYTMRFPFCGSREIHHFFCEMPAVLKLSCEDTSFYEMVVSVICIVFVLLPLGLIMASYMLIFLAVLRMNSPAGRRKALAVCSSHLAVVSLYYGPAMIIYMTPHSFHTLEQDEILSMINTIFTPMLNPLIYSLRNKEVLGALRKAMNRRFTLS